MKKSQLKWFVALGVILAVLMAGNAWADGRGRGHGGHHGPPHHGGHGYHHAPRHGHHYVHHYAPPVRHHVHHHYVPMAPPVVVQRNTYYVPAPVYVAPPPAPVYVAPPPPPGFSFSATISEPGFSLGISAGN